jgi:hypothetical protein
MQPFYKTFLLRLGDFIFYLLFDFEDLFLIFLACSYFGVFLKALLSILIVFNFFYFYFLSFEGETLFLIFSWRVWEMELIFYILVLLYLFFFVLDYFTSC